MSGTLLNLQVWRALGRWLALLARIDARRPASWLALLAAAGGLVSAAQTPVPAAVALGWWAGTLAVVAALGELPDDEQWSGMPTPPWLAGRLLWPLAGLGLGWWLEWGFGAVARGESAWPAGAAVAAGIVAGGAAVRGALAWKARAADASSLALVLGGIAAAGALAVPANMLDAWCLSSASLAWISAATISVAVAVSQSRLAPADRPTQRSDDDPPALPVIGPLRRRLNSSAMVAALMGMVGWLFLDPTRAADFHTMTLAWFVSLAVPLATLGDGAIHTHAWRWLYRSAPVLFPAARSTGIMPRLWRPRLGSDSFSRVMVVSLAAILAWPALVAALILAGDPAVAWRAASTVMALAAAALALVALGSVRASLGWSGDSTQAVALLGALFATLAEHLQWGRGVVEAVQR
jgi:hypothetical protein